MSRKPNPPKLKDTLITIPAGRRVIKSLFSYPTKWPVLIISDPDHYEFHNRIYGSRENIQVVEGAKGLVPQVALTYSVPYSMGYKYVFRLDDDIRPNVFLRKTGGYVSLEELVTVCRMAVDSLQVSLVGPNSSCNRVWMRDGICRSISHLTGGAQLFTACRDVFEEDILDSRITTGAEDVYRTLAHRERDGAVGKINYIAFNKQPSCGDADSLIKDMQNIPNLTRDRDLILARFPEMVSCSGFRKLPGTAGQTMDWKMLGRATKTEED